MSEGKSGGNRIHQCGELRNNINAGRCHNAGSLECSEKAGLREGSTFSGTEVQKSSECPEVRDSDWFIISVC